jgi:uncharacterized metal-binding protein (TIGR02443 family)
MRTIKSWMRAGCPECKSKDFVAYFTEGEHTLVKCRDCMYAMQTSKHVDKETEKDNNAIPKH